MSETFAPAGGALPAEGAPLFESAPLAELAELATAAALAAADTHLAPAVLVAVHDSNGVLAVQGIGEPMRDGAPVRRDTVFRIASMSKSFLAAAALALVEDGRLDLARPVSDYVPGVRFVFEGREESVTLGELLSNRSGMPEDNAWGDRQLGASREEIADLARAGLELSARPGERYQYSNLGMSFVGRAIEAVVGHSVEQEVRGRFIDPLGLARTRYESEDYDPDVELARGFRTFDRGESFAAEPYVGSGALACIGALFSTVDDVARWASFLASSFTDAPLRPELLSPRSRREMQRVHTPILVGDASLDREPEALGYGLGLVVEHDRRFGRIAKHSGGLPGFTSHMRWHLASGLGAIAFGNSDAFRAERLASDALVRLLEAAEAPALVVRPWPATVTAVKRMDELLRTEGSVAGAGDALASNLFRDVPDEVRRREFAILLERLGPIVDQASFDERVLGANDAAHLRWRIDCAGGSLICETRLVGLEAPLVQSLSVAAAGPDGVTPESGAPVLGRNSRVLLG